jgi:hypothetical protein
VTDETPRPAEPADSPGWRPPAEPTADAEPPRPSAEPPVAQQPPHPAPVFANQPPQPVAVPQPVGAAHAQPAGYPPPQWGRPAVAAVPPPPREAWLAPRRVETIPGTNFAVVHLGVPPTTSGLAIGSLVAGIGSVLVSLVVACFGLAGASAGWGAWVAGAFALIAGLAGAAGVVLALLGMRQIRRPVNGIRFAGRGVAISGLVCGAVGLALTLLGFGTSLLIQVSLQ